MSQWTMNETRLREGKKSGLNSAGGVNKEEKLMKKFRAKLKHFSCRIFRYKYAWKVINEVEIG